MSEKRSTDEVTHMRFRPHGRIEVFIDGQIVRYIARGPFTEELIAAYAQIHAPIVQEMAAKTPWADLTIFRESALTNEKSLADYTEYLTTLATQGHAPCATAFVMGPDVKGATVMGNRYANCYQAAGLVFKAFDRWNDAESWVEQELNANTGKP